MDGWCRVTGRLLKTVVMNKKKYPKKNHICVFAALLTAVLMSGCSVGASNSIPEENKRQEPFAPAPADEDAVIVVNEVVSDKKDVEKTEEITEKQGNSTLSEEADDSKRNEAGETMGDDFYITEITDEIFDRIYGKSFKEDCTLPREDLRYLHVLHKDINGIEHEGEMITNYHIAEDMLDILKELYENDYPLEKIRLVDEYGADDELSMEDNNSSSFNFRFVPRTKKISKHGLGLAVDINTLYNPYITKSDSGLRIEPVNAEAYADRDRDFDYKIEKGDLCYELFTSHGFEWGGEWKNSKDYQHFEIPTGKIEEWYPGN